ncbi:MAG TPA: AsmA family protein, partial [Oxalicibacterium sp.]|nr:AsmA family protein [Oxalicibacterium sp.]
EASQLLTSGSVDMRRQEVDLHGRVRARGGVSLGISTFAGDVKIVGKIAKPQLNLDEAGIGGAIARIGAAILTSGVSIVATAIWDGANPESDPCQLVFSAKGKKAAGQK